VLPMLFYRRQLRRNLYQSSPAFTAVFMILIKNVSFPSSFPSITAFLLSRLTGVAKVVIREIMTMLEECRGSLSENYGTNEKRERLVTVFTWVPLECYGIRFSLLDGACTYLFNRSRLFTMLSCLKRKSNFVSISAAIASRVSCGSLIISFLKGPNPFFRVL